MYYPGKAIVEALRADYPIGCRVELISMSDVKAPPEGTRGTVMCVDDAATVHVSWDNGSSLGVVYDVDFIRKL